MRKVVRIEMSDRPRKTYAIELAPGVMYGAYRDAAGFVRYPAWSRKKDAVAALRLMEEREAVEAKLEDFNYVGSRHHY